MEDLSVLSLLGRLVISLAIVLAIMAVLARVLRSRVMPGVGRSAVRRDALQVLARQPLSRSASVAVVRAADRTLVIGVSDTGVSLLAEVDPLSLEPDEPDDGSPVTLQPSWRGFLDTLRERSVRRI